MNHDSISQNPLPIHPRATPPPLPSLHRTIPQTLLLPNDVQHPWTPDKPRQAERNGTRHPRTGAVRDVRFELALWSGGKGVGRVGSRG